MQAAAGATLFFKNAAGAEEEQKRQVSENFPVQQHRMSNHEFRRNSVFLVVGDWTEPNLS